MAITPASSETEMSSALDTLHSHKEEWISIPMGERIAILEKLINRLVAVAPELVAVSLEAKGFSKEGISAAQEWISGPYTIIRNLRRLERALKQIASEGKPRIPGPILTRPNGQIVARVFPQDIYDRIFFSGITADVWMQSGVSIENLAETQAINYSKPVEGKIALVLGAGNVSGLAPTDALHRLFVENQVVLLKLSPVNAYIGPIMKEIFQSLIEPGFLRVVYGGPEEGAYLCNHNQVDEIHVTGSDKTYNSVVFGSGEAGIGRKKEHNPLLTKPVTGELGGVSPVIIIPGPWSDGDLAYHAELMATAMTDNAGYVCSVPRVILQHATWNGREKLLTHLRRILSQEHPRNAYYPGSLDQYETFVKAHPEAERFGKPGQGQLPWTMVTGLDPDKMDDICFTTEAFFGFIAEADIKAKDTADFIDKAVNFANNHLMGTLDAVIIVSHESLKDSEVAPALERASANLRYGTIAINYHPAASWASGVTPWGPFPNDDICNIQSGNGFVHNTMMFSQVQKVVFRAPFRCRPKPAWFLSRNGRAERVFKKLFYFEGSPSPMKVPGILLDAIGR